MDKQRFSAHHPLHLKFLALQNLLSPLLEEGLLIAFSGGVDSSFLLWSAVQTLFLMQNQNKQGRLLPLLAISPSVPVWEVEEAKTFAASLNVDLSIVNSQEISNESYIKNDARRCYFCKSELFSLAKIEAKNRGYKHIAYGYNASDKKDIRFGHVAAQENHIHSPLNDANLEKDEIRTILKEVGLSLADKPASPCLASRIMSGVSVTEEKLGHVQSMEAILRAAGMKLYRVRLHEEGLNHKMIRYFRIEVAPEEMTNLLSIRNALVDKAMQMGYKWVNLDLSGYKLGGGTLV